MNNPKRIEFANTLRGFAALSVLIHHFSGVFWSLRETVSNLINAPVLSVTHATPKYVTLLYSTILFNWGTFGVALFFLISGFVIPFSLQKFTWKEFAINRFFRIVPTYVVGFTITLLAIYFSGLFFDKHFPYHFKETLIHYIPGLRDLLGIRNMDGIIWTLEIEIKFYIICAMALIWFRKGSLFVFLIPVFLGFSAILLNPKMTALMQIGGLSFRYAAIYALMAQYLVFMFIGVAFNYYYRKIISLEKISILIAFLFILFALVSKSSIYKETFHQIWSCGFALLVFAFAYASPRLFKSNKVFDFLADISYPLYVVHGVSGFVLMRILMEVGLNESLCLILATTIMILLAFALHKMVEMPAQKLGKFFVQKEQLKDSSPQLSFSQR